MKPGKRYSLQGPYHRFGIGGPSQVDMVHV